MASLFVFPFLLQYATSELICSDGYSCYEDPNQDIIWVSRHEYVASLGPHCTAQCQEALVNMETYYACDDTQPVMYNRESFTEIATGLGFSCQGGGCWGHITQAKGVITVSSGTGTNKKCYFPPESYNDTWSCTSKPGGANCFGDRFSLICPCVVKQLDQACTWSSPPNQPAVANWGDPEGTSCIDRINYWRKRACDENWVECPPQGLPPMTECTCCHECANSQSHYDKEQGGGHASFTQCGEKSQGSGGGANCAAVIDAFVSERALASDGVMRCGGHCTPILENGCQTFFWGNYQGWHTLNWGSCPQSKCDEYCANPNIAGGRKECFKSEEDIEPNMCGCEGREECVNNTDDDKDGLSGVGDENDGDGNGNNVGAIVGGVIAGFVALALIGGMFVIWKKKKEQKEEENNKGWFKRNKNKKKGKYKKAKKESQKDGRTSSKGLFGRNTSSK